MSIVAKKIMMGSGSTVALPSDDQFNRVSFLSHFDGTNNGVNNVFDDGSTSNHTITANGNVTQGSFGPFARPDGEWGVSFDGNGDSLTFTNDATMSLDGDYTFELFFNAVTIVVDSQQPAVFASATTQLYIHSSGRYISWFGPINGSSSGNIVHSASNSILTNVWNHVAIVRSGTGSNNTSMYLNGTRVQQYQNTQTLGAGSGTARIGSYSAAGGNFDGQISNLRILKGTALYSGSSITVPTAPLTAVSNTKLLTCQSNRFVDNSSTGFALTPVGNTAVTAFGAILTSSVYSAGTNGASAYIAAGDSDYLSMPAQTIPTGNFTVEGWYYLDGTQSNSVIISQGSSGNAGRTFVGIESVGGTQSLRFQIGGSVVNGPASLTNQWTHFCATYNGSAIELFQNGVSAGTTSRSGNSENVAMVIGRLGTGWAGGYGVKGYISDIRVSGVVRQSSDFTPPTAPLTNVDSNVKFLANMADGQAIDSAAQNNLTLFGNTKTSTAQYKYGTSSLLLDGTGDYAVIYDANTVGKGDFTIELWARRSATNNGGFFQFSASALNSSSGAGPGIGVYEGGIYLYYGKTGALQGKDLGGTLPGVGTWFHVAYVRSNGVIQVYVNGTAYGATTDSTVDYTDSVLTLGGWYSSSFLFHGNIDDFRISHMARYTSNFTVPSEPFANKGQ